MAATTPSELPVLFTAAINAGDLPAALELWGEDARIVNADGVLVEGREAIARVLATLIDSGTRIQIETSAVHRCGDVALALGELTMSTADGAQMRTSALAVYERATESGWRVAIDAPWGLGPPQGP